jgi:hypothetical protein
MNIRDFKTWVIDWNVGILRKFGMSDKTIGFLLRTFHSVMPLMATLIMIFGSQLYALLTVIGLIGAFISFFIFNGCLISLVEHRLDNIDITIIDPLIEICKYEVTQQNRMMVSKWAACIYLTFAVAIYYIRFGSIYLHNSIYSDLNVFRDFYQRGPRPTPSI